MDASIAWIAANSKSRNYQLAVHVGDLVQSDGDGTQSAAATASMNRLLGVIPRIVAYGNHDDNSYVWDIDSWLSWPGGGTLAQNQTIWPTLLESEWSVDYSSSQAPVKNSYHQTMIGGQLWGILQLDYFPGIYSIFTVDPTLWAINVLSRHAGIPTILVTHGFVNPDGSFCTRNDLPLVPSPSVAATRYGGTELWNAFVSANSDIRIVLSGHFNNLYSSQTHVRADNSKCHVIGFSHNEQSSGFAFPNGVFQELGFDYNNNALRIRTHAPVSGYFDVIPPIILQNAFR
jgi:hypothetical protein